MKLSRYTLMFLFLLLTTVRGNSQEFDVSKDGFIYDSATMVRLKFITDSLNLKFKKCDPWKTYYGVSQAMCHVVVIDSIGIDEAISDIEAGIDFNSFVWKHPEARVDKNRLVVRQRLVWDSVHIEVEFNIEKLGTKQRYELYSKDSNMLTSKLLGKWVFNYSRRYKGPLEACFFTTEFSNPSIPAAEAKMIQYVDCMIDTNTTTFFRNARKVGGIWWADSDTALSMPTPDRDAFLSFFWQNSGWRDDTTSKRKIEILANRAVEEAMKLGYADKKLENAIRDYSTKANQLKLRRLKIVLGSCSLDEEPRENARSLAILAAESEEWDVFLRAHLDILNDRFHRSFDGSYAQAERETYIRELEALGIDVPDLMLGISFRISNPSGEHYQSSVYRVGRALSETSTPDIVEQKIIAAIEDAELDNYNRVVAYYLYVNYITFLKDPARKTANIVKLRNAVKSLPPGIADGIVVKDEDFERPWD